MEFYSTLKTIKWLAFLAGLAAGSITTGFVCAIEYPSIDYSRAIFIGLIFGAAATFLLASILLLIEYVDAKRSGRLGTWAIIFTDEVNTVTEV